MAKPRGKRAIARGISRGTIQLDACKVNLSKLRRLSPDALGKVWARLHHRKPRGSNHPLHALASWAINLAAAKRSAQIHTGQQRKHAVKIYLHAVNLAKERLQSQCAARALGYKRR